MCNDAVKILNDLPGEAWVIVFTLVVCLSVLADSWIKYRRD